MNGISAFLSGWREEKMATRKPGRVFSSAVYSAAHWRWTVQPPELCDIDIWCLSHSVYGFVTASELIKTEIATLVYGRRQKTWHCWNSNPASCSRSGKQYCLFILSGWFICFYIFQYFKTPVIFLDKPHLFPVPSPATQGFEMACGDALDNKPVPVWTSKLKSPVQNPHLASLFLCSKSYPFLSSLNLYFRPNFSLIFYSILSTTSIFGQFPHLLFCLLSWLYYLK